MFVWNAGRIIRPLKEVDKYDSDVHEYGGKLYGLLRVANLLSAFKIGYNLDVEIPETYGIPFYFHEEYKKNGGVPESLVTEAMHCVVALGGNVAVRSSADVEDSEDCSYSGVFKSVLHVKTREQMRNALNAVYQSAEAVPGAKMGIIIQKMIEQPAMAGVVYSESFSKLPFVTIHYVEGETADELLAGFDDRKKFAILKETLNVRPKMYHNGCRLGAYTRNSRLKDPFYNICERPSLSFSYLHNADAQYRIATKELDLHIATDEEMEKYKNQLLLAMLVCELEEELGYPINMEFARSDNGELYVLQQRRYLDSDFINYANEKFESNYSCRNPIVTGRVIFDGKKSREGDIVVDIDKDIKMVSIHTHNSFNIMINSGTIPMRDTNYIFGGMIGSEHSEFLYNHDGNMKRENVDYSYLYLHGDAADNFPRVEEGDIIRVNFKTGEVKVLERQKEKVRSSGANVMPRIGNDGR